MKGVNKMHHVERQSVKCFIATISDTRTTDTDKSGHLIKQLLEKEQHEVVGHQITKDDKVLIGQMIDEITERNDVEIVLLTGGTGISKRSEEHTSELQSRFDLVCRLLLEKKKL